ncbi:MAG: hypothetical protein JXA73_17665, partial [Acidobacteria bacterium]|nr:hypothetical protein [Acidobacteriota bacterium]
MFWDTKTGESRHVRAALQFRQTRENHLRLRFEDNLQRGPLPLQMKSILTICCLLLQAVALRAADVSLAWDPSVTYYRIYHGNFPRSYSAYDHLGN